MRVLVALDKFKDALTARQACDTVAAALHAKHPGWTIDLCPLTDGGEGFAETLCRHQEARLEEIAAHGPRGATTTAPIGFIPAPALTPAARRRLALKGNPTLAVTGLASASGIELVARDQRDPWQATSRGTGELLAYAAHEGADLILLGLGGSAINDLGLGALAALGLRCLRTDGTAVEIPVPATWPEIVRLEGEVRLPPVRIACDVTNPLLGPKGATATFGPQKGLRADDVPRLEAQMARMAALLCAHFHRPQTLQDTPGAGAAGGFGFGLMVASGATLIPGFDLVSAWLDLPARLASADLVITGEGRFDATSLAGKGPGSLVREARRLGKPVHVFAGSLGVTAEPSFHAITPADLPLGTALPRTAQLLAAAVDGVL